MIFKAAKKLIRAAAYVLVYGIAFGLLVLIAGFIWLGTASVFGAIF